MTRFSSRNTSLRLYWIDVGFSPKIIIEVPTETWYKVVNIVFLNFTTDAKFRRHLWRHNSDQVGESS